MICNRCGKEVTNGANFCNYCGNPLNNNQPSNNLSFNLSKGQKITIIAMMIFIIILLLLAVTINPSQRNVKKETRTVMLYIVGSNLETEGGIVSADLDSIKPENIDLENTNVILYTGGTKEWHNFIKNTENGVYILKKDGFEQIDSQKQLNMGEPSTLSNFINYVYDNYKTEKYDLILYDHGGAIDGAIYDDISVDNLSLSDMDIALKNTPFKEKNKLEAVLFRTCLNGSLEIANVFAPYSKYLIASEEISYGSRYSDVLGFINLIKNKDDGAQFGLKYLNRYQTQMDLIDPHGSVVRTYSVIDLSKIDEVNKALDNFVSNIDIQKNYNEISKVRNSIYQYGQEEENYDMVDLYNLANNLAKYSNGSASNLMKAIDNAVVYNDTNDKTSHGLSIYFPYKGQQLYKSRFINIYNGLNFSKKYNDFIKKFNNIQSGATSFSFDISKNSLSLSKNKQEVSFKLTNEQMKDFAGATYTVFKKDKEHPNYYYLLYNSNDYSIGEDGTLTTKIDGNMLMIDTDEGYQYITSFYRKNGNGQRYNFGSLYNSNLDIQDENYTNSVTYYYALEDGKIKVSGAKLSSNNERIDGILLDLKDYTDYSIYMSAYRILDDNGNVTDEWESAPIIYGYEEKLDKLQFKLSGIEDTDEEYYCVFAIIDVNQNIDYSKLIKIGG